MLGIKIDHYVKVDFNALVEIVDAVGGVEVDVPQDMKWDMSDTGDIKIDLKKGLQTLDGNKALQLVRFRKGYANGCWAYSGAAAVLKGVGNKGAEYGKHCEKPWGLYQGDV